VALKFYLHRAVTGDSGTLPAATVSVSATTPTQIADGTNYSMDSTISAVAQTSKVLTTNAVTTAQASLIVRFLSVPIAAQTIAAQTIHYRCAISESNSNSNFGVSYVLALWRPGTGAVVSRLQDQLNGTQSRNATTTEADADLGTTSTVATAQDGDVLVMEFWRDLVVQGMATSYSNTVFYDGTVEGSATDNAAYVLFANDVAMQAAAAAQVPYVNSMPPLIAQ
jgi:hypothetical protein